VKLLSIIKTLISEDDRLVKGSKVLTKTNYKGYNYVLEYGDHAFRRFDRDQNVEPMTKEEVIEMFYDVELGDDHKNQIKSLDQYKITPAEMTKLMFENFEDYNSCLKKLKNI
jgi:hypothetical protein